MEKEVRSSTWNGRAVFILVLVQNAYSLHSYCQYAAQSLPPIPIDAYHLCIVPRHRRLETVYTSISLAYGVWTLSQLRQTALTLPIDDACPSDFFAFSLTIFLARRSRAPAGLKVPTILGTIAEDATRYFLVIFTSHFVLEMFLIFARVSATVPLLGLQPMMADVSLGGDPTHSSHVSSNDSAIGTIILIVFFLLLSVAMSCKPLRLGYTFHSND